MSDLEREKARGRELDRQIHESLSAYAKLAERWKVRAEAAEALNANLLAALKDLVNVIDRLGTVKLPKMDAARAAIRKAEQP